MDTKNLIRYRVETDDRIRAEYGSLERAKQEARPEEYILEVIYRETRTTILKSPELNLTPEIKKDDWLILTGDKVKRFCIEASLLKLSAEEKKDPLKHITSILPRYQDYMPFRDSEEVTVASVQQKKFGVRVKGNDGSITEWHVVSTHKECVNFLQKTYNIQYK